MNVKFRSDIVVDLIDFMGGDSRAVQAARVSTFGADSIKATQGGDHLIRYLMREKHHVPFEHSVFTFRVEAPIFVTRQLLKHRISSISEESGRYRELDAEFYVPESHRPLRQVGKTGEYRFEEGSALDHEIVREEFVSACGQAASTYSLLLSQGIAKEVARMVLPFNTYSCVYITLNVRSLMNLLDLRTSLTGSHPQYEIEQMATQMEDHFKNKMPVTWEAYRAGVGD